MGLKNPAVLQHPGDNPRQHSRHSLALSHVSPSTEGPARLH
jgi:hypothetical protein